jgi:hypothetical protein
MRAHAAATPHSVNAADSNFWEDDGQDSSDADDERFGLDLFTPLEPNVVSGPTGGLPPSDVPAPLCQSVEDQASVTAPPLSCGVADFGRRMKPLAIDLELLDMLVWKGFTR